MKLFMQNLPQFGEPYITDNGDIVIPRIQPKNPPSEPTEKSEEKKESVKSNGESFRPRLATYAERSTPQPIGPVTP